MMMENEGLITQEDIDMISKNSAAGDFEKKEERAEEQIIEHALKEESSSLGENKKCTPLLNTAGKIGMRICPY